MKKIILVSMIILVSLISCRDDEKRNEKKNLKAELIIHDKAFISDTVYLNEKYGAVINYRNDLDTVTTSFDDLKKARYVYYAFTTAKNNNHNDDYFKKEFKDTCGAKNNRQIFLYDIIFKSLGVNYIDGIITDEVMIENGAKNEKGESMTRIITDEIRLTKKVIVVERKK